MEPADVTLDHGPATAAVLGGAILNGPGPSLTQASSSSHGHLHILAGGGNPATGVGCLSRSGHGGHSNGGDGGGGEDGLEHVGGSLDFYNTIMTHTGSNVKGSSVKTA